MELYWDNGKENGNYYPYGPQGLKGFREAFVAQMVFAERSRFGAVSA